MSGFANSLPRSAWNTSMSIGGNPSAAKAAFTSRVLPAACRVPHDLAVVQVYEQASVVPFAAYAHVGEIAHDVGMGRVAVELAVEDVGRLRLARLGGTGLYFLRV